MPACTPIVMRPLAQEICSSDSTRFGIAARDAERNGSSAIADPKARTIRVAGACTNTIARKNPAEIASDQIITFLRSKRSPRAPATEPRSPATPKVRSNDNACMLAECVRSHTVKLRAVYAAAPPVIEINRPTARRRILERADRWRVLMERLLERWFRRGDRATAGCGVARGGLSVRPYLLP